MTQLQKYLSFISQFSDKLQSQINKKYRPFLKSLFARNIEQRNKNINKKQSNVQKQKQKEKEKDKDKQQQKIVLGQQMIAFKLGIQSKSTKCIQVTLGYLNKMFDLGYIDLGAPNYCLNFVILQANVQRKKIDKIQQQMKTQIIKWLSPLVHFKNNQINSLLVKIYRHLIGQPIINSLIQLVQIYPNQHSYSLLHSFFNYRFYLFQQVYYYKKQQIAQFKHIATNQRLSGQVNNALNREQQFQNMVGRYLNQIVVKIAGVGGKYGYCVVCDQPAQYFCKVTKASLCGIQCKKAHLQVAQKHYKNYYQAVYLYKSINQSIKILAKHLSQNQSPFIFSIMANLFQKPYLFQLVKNDYKIQMRSFLPGVLYKAYQSKNQQIVQTLYFMISSLAKWWPTQSLAQIQFFIKQHLIKILSDKRPNFRQLILVFKCLDKIFQHGRSVVQLYTNLDCQINQINAIGNILFQLSKIAQDKFTNSNHYNKQQKVTIKNSCMTLFTTFARSLNDFRRNYPHAINVKQLDVQKTRKSNLQAFITKFNEHWSQGLKCLFNLNLVGLDSNHQIVNIIMSLAGLNKKMIDMMLFDKICQQYLQIFISRLEEEDQTLPLKLLSFYKFIPMTQNNSIGILKFVQAFSSQFKIPDLLGIVKRVTSIFMKADNFEDFKNKIKQHVPADSDFRYLYLRMLSVRKLQTVGKKKRIYTLCLSQSYIQPLSSQISLLQIPLSYMLQTSYDPERIILLIRQLTSICIHSNWISLLVKHSGIDTASQQLLTPYNIKIIRGILDIVIMQADQIMDWLTILGFICNVYYLLSLTHPSNKKYLTQNKTILLQQLNPLNVQSSLANASIKCVNNFVRFINGVLVIAKQYLIIDQIMMLQKFFHILDANVQKYITNFLPIFQQFQKFIQHLSPKTTPQTYIYITDMLKQLLLKLIKSTDLSDFITVKHLQIFKLILSKNTDNKQIGDFVMNALSTIVVHNYNLKPRSWIQIIKIVDQQVINYPYQTGVIIRKVLNQHMKNIQEQSQSLLKICYKLIRLQDEKASVQAIHDIKLILDLQKQIIQNKMQQQKQLKQQLKQKQIELQSQNQKQQQYLEYKQIQKFKTFLLLSINQLIKYIGQSFSQAVAQTLFLLFSFKINNYHNSQHQNQSQQSLILTQKQIDDLITKIFNRLEQMQKQHLSTAQRIMNQTLFWSVRNKYKNIIHNLQLLIIGKYTALSITSLKCIKTYIQMANLRDQKQWADVQQTLLRIIDNTQVQRYFGIQNIKQFSMEETIEKLLQNKLQIRNNKQGQQRKQQQSGMGVDIDKFIHECKVQMMGVELLPNHHKCLSTLQSVYQNKVKFNDLVMLRMQLWHKGLGRDYPPDLLNLQQTISNRIMAIHIWQNNPQQVLSFCYKILQKYINSTLNLQKLQQYQIQINAKCNKQNIEMYKILIDYWNKRRQPLNKLISYIMPKLGKYCQNKQDRKKLLRYFIKIVAIMENKQGVLKVITELADKKIQ